MLRGRKTKNKSFLLEGLELVILALLFADHAAVVVGQETQSGETKEKRRTAK